MKTRITVFSVLLLMATSLTAKADPIEEGKVIFMSRCAGCHNVQKVLTGPALGGVDQRHSIDWIVNFVHSSQTMVKNGDPQAVALFNSFNRVPMPDHPDLSEADIKNIVEYIKTQASTAAATVVKSGISRQSDLLYRPLTLQNDYLLFAVYLLAVAVLVSILLFVVRVRTLANKEHKE